MKNLAKLFLIFPIVFFTACGGNDEIEEEDNIDIEKNPLGALMQMSENMEEQAKKMEEKQKDRKDAKALHYEELMKYLPSAIDGYTVDGDPYGESIDMGGMSYSTAEIKFKNEAGDRIKINLMDYNATFSMYNAATAMWATGMKIDNSNELSQGIKFDDNINGFETIKKKSGKANLVLGVGNRFMLTIDGSNQKNTDELKDVAKSMDLDALSSLE